MENIVPMPSATTNIQFCHRRSDIVRAAIAALCITLIGIAFTLIFIQQHEAVDRFDMLLAFAVCSGLLLLGSAVLVMSLIRLYDPIYLNISENGEGRYRPYFTYRYFSIDPASKPRILHKSLLLRANHDGSNDASTASQFSIYLPSTVKITRGEAALR